MYLQEILEVTIGLIFMWLVLSIAVMQLMEWIAAALQWRAKTLKEAIRQMLQDNLLTEAFYHHPLIISLSQKRKDGKPLLPSFIPADKFALALFDLAVTAGTEAFPLRQTFEAIETELERLDDPLQRKLAQEDWNTIIATARELASSSFGEAALDTLKARLQEYRERYPELQEVLDAAIPAIHAYYESLLEEQLKMEAGGQAVNLTLRQVRLGLLALEAMYPHAQVQRTLGALLAGVEEYVSEGEQALAVARQNVEKWFNDTMDRLSGLYKRKVQTVSFLVGLLLALFLNIDSVNIATSLWREPTLRQSIVAQAEAYVQQQSQGAEEEGMPVVSPVVTVKALQDQLHDLTLPVGWVNDPIPRQDNVTCHPYSSSEYAADGAPTHIMGVPIGRVCYPLTNVPPLDAEHWVGWLVKVLGMLISGAAAAQGAPFWFDILKKFVNIRSSGPKPDEK
jgi:hypothetical protein